MIKLSTNVRTNDYNNLDMDNCFNKIIYFDKLASSNDYLINLYKKQNFLDVLTVYVNHQVSGRGRMGKTWFSGGEDGLSFSFSCHSLILVSDSYW